MCEAFADIGRIVFPEVAEPRAERLAGLGVCVPSFVEEAAGAEVSDYARSIASREGRIVEGMEDRFKGEGMLKTSTPFLGGRYPVAHPLGDAEQRLIAVRGRKRTTAETKACIRVTELNVVKARSASHKN